MRVMPKPFRQLDLNLLRLLVALHRTRSVTAAGRALALSQPAASNALARLRRHFDDALFVPSPGGLLCTPAAERLAAAAALHLEALQREIDSPAEFDPTTGSRTWRLSLSDLGEMVFLPAITHAVLSRSPGSRIVNAAVAREQLAASLAQREVDMAIGVLDAEPPGLRHDLLFCESYVALSDPTRVSPQRSVSGLKRLALLVAAPTATFHGGIDAWLASAGLDERVVLRTRHFAAIPELVRSAPLVAVVPASWAAAVCQRAPLQAWPLPLKLPDYGVRMVWHATCDADAALGWLRDTVRPLFQHPAATRPKSPRR
jgi:DNA-binding transcriptional LysR family regulator